VLNFSKWPKKIGAAALLLAMLMAQLADVILFDVAHLDSAATHSQMIASGSDAPPLNDTSHPTNHFFQHLSLLASTIELAQFRSPESAFLPVAILRNGRSDRPSTPPPLV